MANTLGNIEIQEIESINVMSMDTPLSFGEVMPRDASNDAEELNIQPCLGLEFESLEKVREFYNSFAKKNGDIAINWVIKSFSNDHNHVMLSPKSVCYMRCHKKMSVVAQSLVEKLRKSILFGCALLQDESENSFTWLFQTWLKEMGGKKPVSIITDQDLAIGAVIKKVFLETRHRLCLWHIRKEFPEKLAHGLYMIKESWIPIFSRSTFFAGMNTIERSEGINAFFDSFVHSRTTLQEFVVKFEKVFDCRLEVEKRKDYESRHKSHILSTGSKLGHHAAFVYTRNVFGKFQDEQRKINEFTKKKIGRDGPSYVYQVSSCYDARDTFIVNVDLDSKVAKCDCHLFEFIGILCRHILDANKCIEVSDAENNFDGQSTTPRILRRMHAQQQASILVDLAEESKEIYRFIVLELGQTHKSTIVMKTSLSTGDNIPLLESSLTIGNKLCMPEQVSEVPHLILGDPHISQTKEIKKDGEKVSHNNRLKSGLEVSLNKSLVKRKTCHECGEHGHNNRTCKKTNLND
ncbi:hypothetical protein GYH30_047357 [Glycine max]|nr:hypothetical protein GYH30_047357 [Glycine max]